MKTTTIYENLPAYKRGLEVVESDDTYTGYVVQCRISDDPNNTTRQIVARGDKETAALIVKAVNNHDALVAALRHAHTLIQDHVSGTDNEMCAWAEAQLEIESLLNLVQEPSKVPSSLPSTDH